MPYKQITWVQKPLVGTFDQHMKVDLQEGLWDALEVDKLTKNDSVEKFLICIITSNQILFSCSLQQHKVTNLE